MTAKDGASTRKDRLNILMDLVAKHQDEWTENKTKGIFMLQTGLTKAKINSYIQELVDVEVIERKDGKLWSLV